MWTAGVDYIRLTYKEKEGVEDAELCYARACRRAGAATEGSGYIPRPWAWMGYYGNSIGSAAHGSGPQGAILQCSGAAAQLVLDEVLPWTGCPRIDIQYTVWFGHDDEGRAARESAKALGYVSPAGGRKAAVRLVSGFGKGDTLYVGTRGKDSRFLRLYDKYRESGKRDDYAYAWRYEAELTDSHARAMLRHIEAGGQDAGAIAALVAGQFERCGLALPSTDVLAAVQSSGDPREPSSAARRLEWLKRQVRPALRSLLADGVSREEIEAALWGDKGE